MNLHVYADVEAVESMAKEIAWKLSSKTFKNSTKKFKLRTVFLKVKKRFWKYPCFKIEGKYGCCDTFRAVIYMSKSGRFMGNAYIYSSKTGAKTKEFHGDTKFIFDMLRNKKGLPHV